MEGKCYTDCEKINKKFFFTANNAASLHNLLNEECFLHVLRAKCILILTYVEGLRKAMVMPKIKLVYYLIMLLKRSFIRSYLRLKNILRCSCMLLTDFYILRTRLI